MIFSSVLLLALLNGVWESSVQERLEAVIEENRGNADAYAVFDFDYTLAVGDITYTCLWAILDRNDIRVDDLETKLKQGIDPKYFPQIETIVNCRKANDQDGMIRAIWNLYYEFLDNLGACFACDWRARFFDGYDNRELAEVVLKAVAEDSSHDAYIDPRCPKPFRGFRIAAAMKDLVGKLREAGISVYVVSGSSEKLLRPVAKQEFGLGSENVFGCDTGVRIGRKPDFIRERIFPKHHGKEPILVAGDSMGDYAMFTEFGAKSLVFDRGIKGKPLTALIERGRSGDKRILVQGRDEIKGTHLPQSVSVLAK